MSLVCLFIALLPVVCVLFDSTMWVVLSEQSATPGVPCFPRDIMKWTESHVYGPSFAAATGREVRLFSHHSTHSIVTFAHTLSARVIVAACRTCFAFWSTITSSATRKSVEMRKVRHGAGGCDDPFLRFPRAHHTELGCATLNCLPVFLQPSLALDGSTTHPSCGPLTRRKCSTCSTRKTSQSTTPPPPLSRFMRPCTALLTCILGSVMMWPGAGTESSGTTRSFLTCSATTWHSLATFGRR